MGLSQKRRADKRSAKRSPLPCNLGDARRRTGNTLRKPTCAASAKTFLGVNSIYFDLKPVLYSNSNQLTARFDYKETAPENIAPAFLHNHINHNIKFNSSYVDTRVHYSTNKHRRWDAAKYLTNNYQDLTGLKDTYLRVVEQKLRYQNANSNSTVSVSTNCNTIRNLNHQLKRISSLKSTKSKHSALIKLEKKLLNLPEQNNDCMQTIKPINNKAFFVIDRILDEFKVSIPKKLAEKGFESTLKRVQEIVDDFDAKPHVTVNTVSPGLGRANCLYNQSGSKYCLNDHCGQEKHKHIYSHRLHAKVHNEQQRLARFDRKKNALLERDYYNSCQDYLEVDDISDNALEFNGVMECIEDDCFVREKKFNLMDYVKHKPKQRTKKMSTGQNSNRSSGYESFDEDDRVSKLIYEGNGDDKDVESAEVLETKKKDAASEIKLLADIDDFIQSENRIEIQLASDEVTEKNLKQLFCPEQIWWSATYPAKFTVLSHDHVSEAVVFEEQSRSQSHVNYRVLYNSKQSVFNKQIFQSQLISSDNPLNFLAQTPIFNKKQTKQNTCSSSVNKSQSSQLDVYVFAQRFDELEIKKTALKDSKAVLTQPLNQMIDMEFVAKECPICFASCNVSTADFSEELTCLVDCGHSYCNYCLINHVIRSIRQGNSVIGCPTLKCKTVIDATTVLWLAPIRYFNVWVGNMFRRWINNAKSQSSVVGYCNKNGCNAFIGAAKNKNVICLCKSEYCLQCKGDSHWPVDCKTYSKYLNKMQSLGHDKFTQSDITSECEVKAKNCPTCNTVMEKGTGCNHMTCVCGENFCWNCLQTLRDHQGSTCSSYNKDNEGQKWTYKKTFKAADSLLQPNSYQSNIYISAVKHRLHRSSTYQGLMTTKRKNAMETLIFVYQRKCLKQQETLLFDEANLQAKRLGQLLNRAEKLVESTLVAFEYMKCSRREKLTAKSLSAGLADIIKLTCMELDNLAQCTIGPKLAADRFQRLQNLHSQLSQRSSHLYKFTTRNQNIYCNNN